MKNDVFSPQSGLSNVILCRKEQKKKKKDSKLMKKSSFLCQFLKKKLIKKDNF